MKPGSFAVPAVALGALAIALFLGGSERAAADTVGPVCAEKHICVAITDLEQASRSPAGSDHYLSDSVTVANGGTTANLVNITLTLTWRDESTAETTSEFRPAFSDTRCVQTGARAITCTGPKSLRPGESVTFGPLVFRTATDDGASSTVVSATAAAKEQTKPSKGGAPPNDAFVTVENKTPYEGSEDRDVSIAGAGISATLATAQVGRQFSTLPVPSSAPRDLFELLEEDYGPGGATCPAGFTCIGQHVTTTAPGLGPVNVRITYAGPIPPGLNAKSLVVLHTREGETEPTVIDDACSGALFSGQPPSGQIPCRRVEITRLPGGDARVQVDAWDLSNGGWGVG